MLKEFGSFLGWLSGSLAAISAFLYALGYFATMAENRLLGISFAVATRTPEFYIERGGSIVMRTVILGVWPVLGLVLMTSAARWLAARANLGPHGRFGTATAIVRAATPPVAALGMLALTFIAIGEVVHPALSIKELLFETRTKEKICQSADGVSRAILALDREALSDWFREYALFAGSVAGLGVAFRSALLREGHGLWLSVAGLAGFLTLGALPLAYGILAAEKSAPTASIEPALAIEEDAPVRLLARTERGILVWLEDRPVVQWISLNRIDTLSVHQPKPITTISCSGAKTSPNGE